MGNKLKSILITGGFGFIGTTLLELLLQEEDAHIHVVDNMSTSPIVLDHFLGTLQNKENFSYDLVSVQDFFHLDQKTVWNEIYHLASSAEPKVVNNEELSIFEVNFIPGINFSFNYISSF